MIHVTEIFSFGVEVKLDFFFNLAQSTSPRDATQRGGSLPGGSGQALLQDHGQRPCLSLLLSSKLNACCKCFCFSLPVRQCLCPRHTASSSHLPAVTRLQACKACKGAEFRSISIGVCVGDLIKNKVCQRVQVRACARVRGRGGIQNCLEGQWSPLVHFRVFPVLQDVLAQQIILVAPAGG